MPGFRQQRKKVAAQSSFCSLCNVVLNSEFQTCQHYGGKTHLRNMNEIGVTSDQHDHANPGSNSQSMEQRPSMLSSRHLCHHGFHPSPGSSKRSATEIDGDGPPDVKKPRLSPSISGVHGERQLELLNECRPGVEFLMTSVRRRSRAVRFAATVEVDGKEYNADGRNKRQAQFNVATTVLAHIESCIDEALTQGAAEEGQQLLSGAKEPVAEAPKDSEDFTSLDNIYSNVSFSRFSRDVGTSGPGVNGAIESVTKTIGDSGVDQSRKGDSTYSVTDVDASNAEGSIANAEESGVTGAVRLELGTPADDDALPGGREAKVPVASPDVKMSRSSTAILNLVRPGTTSDPRTEECVITIIVDGVTFKGRAVRKKRARAYAARQALAELFGMTFRRSKKKVPISTGGASEIVKAKKTKQTSAPADDNAALDLVDKKNPMVLLNEIFQGQAAYRFYPQISTQRGIKHRCSITIGGMTVEGQGSTKKGAKIRAALAAVAALKASGMYTRLFAENQARRIVQVHVKEASNETKMERNVELKSYANLRGVLPEAEYKLQVEVVNKRKKKKKKQKKGAKNQAALAEAGYTTQGEIVDSLGKKKTKKQKKALLRAKSSEKLARKELTEATSATGFALAPQPTDGWASQALSHLSAPARGQGMSGPGHGNMTRGLGRGIVASEQSGRTVLQGQGISSMNTVPQQLQEMRGRGMETVLAIGGNYYDTGGSVFSTGLTHGGPSSTPPKCWVDFAGGQSRGSPFASSMINLRLMNLANCSNQDVVGTGCDMTSDEVAYHPTHDSALYCPPTVPYATSTQGFYSYPSSPSHSVPHPGHRYASANRGQIMGEGQGRCRENPPVVSRDITSGSDAQIEDGINWPATTHLILRGTRARQQHGQGSTGALMDEGHYGLHFQ